MWKYDRFDYLEIIYWSQFLITKVLISAILHNWGKIANQPRNTWNVVCDLRWGSAQRAKKFTIFSPKYIFISFIGMA